MSSAEFAELEERLNRLSLELKSVERALPNYRPKQMTPGAVDRIQQLTANFFDQPVDVMTCRLKPEWMVWPRQVAMTLCHEFTKLSLKEIGRAFGGRTHGAVLHAVRRVADFTDVSELHREDVNRLRVKVQSEMRRAA